MNYKFYCLFDLIHLYNLINIDNINIIFLFISLTYNFYLTKESNAFQLIKSIISLIFLYT